MSPPGNLYVRANYLATVVFGSLLALLFGAGLLYTTMWSLTIPQLMNLAIMLGAMSVFLIPGIRAFRRLIADGTVIPPGLVSERPVVAFVVALVGNGESDKVRASSSASL
jgi:hypothetical protein